MKGRVGVILLDGTEVIVAIFALTRDLKWEKLYYQVRDLTTFEPQKPVDYLAIMENLAEVLLFGLKLSIKNWKVLSRNLSDEFLKQISQVTKLKIRNLNLRTEQDLICRGILNET